MVSRRPLYHPASVALWLWIASGWCPVVDVSRIVKTASSRGRTGRTLFGHGDCCSPQARLAGRLCVVRHFDITSRVATPDIRLASVDAFRGGGTADAQAERMGATPNRAVVVKTAQTCGCWSHNGTVLERRPGRMKIYLVTMSARCSVLDEN